MTQDCQSFSRTKTTRQQREKGETTCFWNKEVISGSFRVAEMVFCSDLVAYIVLVIAVQAGGRGGREGEKERERERERGVARQELLKERESWKGGSEEEKEKNVCVAARARCRVSSDLFFRLSRSVSPPSTSPLTRTLTRTAHITLRIAGDRGFLEKLPSPGLRALRLHHHVPKPHSSALGPRLLRQTPLLSKTEDEEEEEEERPHRHPQSI